MSVDAGIDRLGYAMTLWTGPPSSRPPFPRPAWATSTVRPVPVDKLHGWHTVKVTAGDVTLRVEQRIAFTGQPQPVLAKLRELPRTSDTPNAQGCRDLAAALLEAAEIIEAAEA